MNGHVTRGVGAPARKRDAEDRSGSDQHIPEYQL